MTQPTPIEIYRAGRHTATNGQTFEFSEAQLQACADAYDPALHEAPIVVGHPKDNGPAYGWVRGLGMKGGILAASPHQVEPQFAEMVGAGRFKKISASFYLPDSPSNPKPGVLYLRHVGFLGAQPPAVKGLKDASFGDGDAGVIEFADWDDLQVARLFRGLREWFIGKFGQDEADKVIPGYAVDQLQNSAVTETDDDSDTSSFLEARRTTSPTGKEPNMPQPQAQEADFAERKRGLDQREAEIAKREAAQVKADWTNFTEGLVRAGKLTPAQSKLVMALGTQLPSTAQIVEFAEDGTKTSECSAREVLRTLVSLLPKQVDFSERAPVKTTGNVNVDMANADSIHRAAVEFQETERKAGRDVSFELAVEHVAAQHEGASK